MPRKSGEMDGCHRECALIKDRGQSPDWNSFSALSERGWRKARERIQYYQAYWSACNDAIYIQWWPKVWKRPNFSSVLKHYENEGWAFKTLWLKNNFVKVVKH